MRKYYIMFLFLFRNGIADVYAQEVPVKHIIGKGETIALIAQKYAVSLNDLYELNPGLKNGFKENDVILISKSKTQRNTASGPIYHLVQANETKYGLSKKYNISIAELERQNPQIISMLQKGHELTIQGKSDVGHTNLARVTESEGYKAHVVVKGETLWELSRVYKITVDELINENRANLGTYLQIGQTLRIPSKNQEQEGQDANLQYYIVEAGETKYGLAKRFGISIKELENLNPHIVAMLRTGSQIGFPKKESVQKTNLPLTQVVQASKENQDQNLPYESHTVVAGETKSGLSRRFGVSIEELESLNPQIVDMLRTGQEISIPREKSGATIVSSQVTKSVNPSTNKQLESENLTKTTLNPLTENLLDKKLTSTPLDDKGNATNLVIYEVKPQETLYGLSKMSGLSREKLIELNPELINGVKNGMKLNIPSENLEVLLNAKESAAAVTQVGLLKSLQRGKEKEIAFLMPFTAEKYEELIKTPKSNEDKVNAYLEFYAGATMAMDSLRKNNVLIKAKIFKIDEFKTSDDNFSELSGHNIKDDKIVFVPSMEFYSAALGNYLSEYNIPMLISSPNLGSSSAATTYTSLPSNEHLRKMVLDYISARKENLIVVSAPSRLENKDFISKNYPLAKFVKISESGNLDSESLRSMLSTTEKNYIVLDTDKSGLILETTTILLKESPNFMVQLVLLEPKENIIDGSLSDMRFRILKMIYPATLKPKESSEVIKFKKEFVTKYGFEPGLEAVRGFDITFDGLLRLFQEKKFETVAKESTTEQLYLKFKYNKNVDQGYFNAGGYILQYDEESDAKIIN